MEETEKKADESAAVTAGNAFARFASAVLSRMNSTTCSAASPTSSQDPPAPYVASSAAALPPPSDVAVITAASPVEDDEDDDGAAGSADKEGPLLVRQESKSPTKSPKSSKSPSLSPVRFRRRRKRSTSPQTATPTPSPRSSRTPSPRSLASSDTSAAGGSSAAAGSAAGGGTLSPTGLDGSSSNTLTVPGSSFLGAIPRPRPHRIGQYPAASSTESEPASSSCATELSTPSSTSEARRCFCGYYSEHRDASSGRKPGRCKFCRSRAKYIPGQRSFDASRLFGGGGDRNGGAASNSGGISGGGGPFGRRRERGEPRRAASEDRRSDGMTTEDTSASTSAATTAQSSFDRPSPSSGLRPPSGFFSTPPFLRRQERLEVDPPSPNLLTVPSPTLASAAVPAGFPGPDGNSGGGGSGGGNGGRSLFLPVGGGYGGGRDHGLRTPPAPPMQQQLQTAIPEDFQDIPSDYALTHRMAHEMPEYLVPPPRTAILARAHTDPEDYGAVGDSGGGGAVAVSVLAPPRPPPPLTPIVRIPASPPPAYSEIVKEAPPRHRSAPPTYEEALNSALADQHRIPTSSRPTSTSQQQQQRQHLAAAPTNVRSLSEERTMATGGQPNPAAAAAAGTIGLHATSASTATATATPYRGGRGGGSRRTAAGRPLMTRSSRAEEIPDIYWEQAARELDFCTCRKCQARYRQYFEEDPACVVAPGTDGSGIPMETQVLMQEVLSDGMAFCSVM